MNEDNAGTDRAATLRNQVVDGLIADATITSASVEQAMRTVAREAFAPEASLEDVYRAYDALVTKRDEHGNALSSVSAPHVQAFMLEQAEITSGMRILEVGSGGYNAALLAELVGDRGEITTVDIDPDVTERASRLLQAAGYPQVHVVLADAEHGVPEHAPYDRILVTAGAWDVPPVWIDQLAPDGLLLVPLRMCGLTRTIAFERADDQMISRSARLFGFVPVQGAGAHQSTMLVLRQGEISLRFDDGTPADPQLLERAFATPRTEIWSGASIGRTEPMAIVQMWLATTLPGFCMLHVDPALDSGVVSLLGKRAWAHAVVDGDSLAYLTTRPTAVETSVEFGVHAYGPHAAELAGAAAEQLRIWGRDHRGGPGPRFALHPAGTPDADLPGGRVIDKHHSRITISWPDQAATTAVEPGVLHDPTE